MLWEDNTELFFRFLPEPRLLLVLLMLALLLTIELLRLDDGSLALKVLDLDLGGRLEPKEGREDEWAEGIWGDEADTCLDCSVPEDCGEERAFRVVPYDRTGLLS